MTHRATEEVETSPGLAALAAVLATRPDALVAALGGDARLVPVPASVPVWDQRPFGRHSGLDLVVPDDVVVIIDGWRRAQVETVVTVDVRLLIDPDHLSTFHFIDVRADHGVHILVVEVSDASRLLRVVEARDERRPLVGRVRRDELAAFLDVDAAACALLGWTRDELVGRRTIDFIHPEDVDRAVESWLSLRSGASNGRSQVRFRRADGHYAWLEITSDDQLDDPLVGCVLSEVVDISDQMAHLEALMARERHLHHLAEALPIGICHLRADRQVVYSNAPLVDLLGAIEDVEALVRSVAAADRGVVELAINRALLGEPGAVEVGVTRGFGPRRCDLTFRNMTNEQGGTDGVIVCAADVTERSRLRSELEHRADHDALTGCLNRAAIVGVLEQTLLTSTRVSVAFIDIDDLKAINDELGHAAGDELLRVTAARLRSVTRANDALGRLGGDEFVVICPHGPADASAFTERLSRAVGRDVTLAGRSLPLRASIGVAVSREGELSAEAVLSRADAAMYEVKRRSRSQVRSDPPER
ncbi:MAG: GGDEF domain-containing protein [Acidimicrobiales bacterium]